MDWKDFLLMTLLIFGMAAVGVAFCVWMTKKAGIPLTGLGYHEKRFYDNCTSVPGSGRRTPDRYRSRWYSKKGGKLSVELTHTRGTMVLEFYTEDDRVLQRWEPGDPLAFTVELPPKTEVWWRADMNHFSGSICFR